MRNAIGVVVLAALVGVAFAASGRTRAAGATVSALGQVGPPAAAPKSAAPGERVEVPPPPFTDGIFPCSTCHADLVVNRTRRALTDMHTDIVLSHDAQGSGCSVPL